MATLAMDSTSDCHPADDKGIMFLIHHLFLPPQLPQQDDTKPSLDRLLLDTVQEALLQYGELDKSHKGAVAKIVRAVGSLRAVLGSDGELHEGRLAKSLEGLSSCQSQDTTLVHVAAQNACLYFHRENGNITVETFELSALNQAVMSTQGRLRRSFPGATLIIDTKDFAEPKFRSALARTLATMSHQKAQRMQPTARKAGEKHDEERDTTHPGLVTELLVGSLRPFSEVVEPTSTVWKHTRDEVLWLKCLSPWRRSPMWMLLKVVVQLILERATPDEASVKVDGRSVYKMAVAFVLSRALAMAIGSSRSISSDMIFCMSAKISRRLLKLQSSAPDLISSPAWDHIERTLKKAHQLLQQRWATVMARKSKTLDLEALKSLEFKQDVTLSLPELDTFIARISARDTSKASTDFTPPRDLVCYNAQKLAEPVDGNTAKLEYLGFNLAAFEDWVARHLEPWAKTHRHEEGTCEALRAAMAGYASVAGQYYLGNPEGLSTMILTIIELWVACDKSAACHLPLLKQYSPGIPVHLLQLLLLPLHEDMVRLARVEEYIMARHSAASQRGFILEDFGKSRCFAVRYFESSPSHRALMSKIVAAAQQARDTKIRELNEKKQRHDKLSQLHKASVCEEVDQYRPKRNDYVRVHSSDCQRCMYVKEMRSIHINMHEWPLPECQLASKSAVFELNVPPSFGAWREATLFLLQTVIQCRYSREAGIRSGSAGYTLENYDGLKNNYKAHATRRKMDTIRPLSEDKPNAVTHRNRQPIAKASLESVCVKNGLSYQYHDPGRDQFVRGLEPTDAALQMCTHVLPPASAVLQDVLYRRFDGSSDKSPNEIIAMQHSCPAHMSLAEFRALALVPIGEKIQWQNILVQLACPVVDFKKLETTLFIRQTIFQTGPGDGESGTHRPGHAIFKTERFCAKFLAEIESAAQRIRKNWESIQALRTFVALATRTLSLGSSSTRCREKALSVLAALREIALEWTVILEEKCEKTDDDGRRGELLAKTVDSALVCCESFDVNERFLGEILADEQAASILVQCAITIQECSPQGADSAAKGMQLVARQSWRRLSYRAYPILRDSIVAAKKNTTFLDSAVKEAWPTFRRGATKKWKSMPSSDHWLRTSTQANGDENALPVHYNLLTGELLVNGRPLSRMPTEYESHPSYRRLFGEFTVRVMPTLMGGMQFASKQPYHGHTLYFGLDGNELLVRAESEDGMQVLDLIPARVFEGVIPSEFSRAYFHWYNHRTGTVEFRPFAWTASLESAWTLSRSPGWTLSHRGLKTLVGPASHAGRKLCAILAPLRPPLEIHITLSADSSQLDIDLRGLSLVFEFRQGESLVRSRQYRGMVIDSDQGTDTLVGLVNKLVLVDPKGEKDRVILVPFGQVSSTMGNHTSVAIAVDPAPTLATVHAYAMDKTLGRLTDNGSLQSKLFLAILHALTSFCLPDPFTRATGTEQALATLGSAAVRSFGFLTAENLDLLAQIGHLSPGRAYYPRNERVMQTVNWSGKLGFLAQHNRFHSIVSALFQQDQSTSMLHAESASVYPKLRAIDPSLLARDSSRSSTFRISGFGAGDHLPPESHDSIYAARDRGMDSPRAQRSRLAAELMYSRSPLVVEKPPPSFAQTIWNTLRDSADEVCGPKPDIEANELDYDGKWLAKDSLDRLAGLWCRFHRHRNGKVSESNFNRYQLATWLASMAFSDDTDMDILRAIAAIHSIPILGHNIPPEETSFALKHGTTASRGTIAAMVESSVIPFHNHPLSKQSPLEAESDLEANKRLKAEWHRAKEKAVSTVVDHLCTQGLPRKPCITLSNSVQSEVGWCLTLSKAMPQVNAIFGSWFKNDSLKKYLESVCNHLHREKVDRLPTARGLARLPAAEFVSYPAHERLFIQAADLFAPNQILRVRKSEDVSELASITLGVARSDGDDCSSQPSRLIKDLRERSQTSHESHYADDLQRSLEHLRKKPAQTALGIDRDAVRDTLARHLSSCKDRVKSAHATIEHAINWKVGHLCPFTLLLGHAPRISPLLILGQMSRQRWELLSPSWRSAIVRYGVSLTELQRARRLLRFVDTSPNDLVKELSNPGHTDWDPLEHPEWLLLEIESGIMIRAVQAQIANKMMAPPRGQNAVMQLNMGEGKSSVIVPIIAAALADGQALVRVLVAKPQSKQMFRMLLSKLGGLIDRQIFHMPFSRALRLSRSHASSLRDMCRRCADVGGVMLVQPEHILSFKLAGLECHVTGQEDVGQDLLQTQHWLDHTARDIVDESDENFNPKFELVYTIGTNRPIDFAPERWIMIQRVLGLVRQLAPQIQKQFPLTVEIHDGPRGSFPRVRLTHMSTAETLVGEIARSICEEGFPGFPVVRQTSTTRAAVFKYITQHELSSADALAVENGPFWLDMTTRPLLLLRGLFADGVLAFVFGEKRWRVNYGLDESRQPPTKLAVPFRAKDSPSPRSEFSHPDVTIVLTCLSYYYGGLTDDDLFLAFETLISSDQSDDEYQEWLTDAPTLPRHFRQLQGVNLKDMAQCKTEMFGHLRFAKSVIDYFLSHVVFPKHAREFPQKLSASGWDLGVAKARPTTGFSGTIDSRAVLPLDVKFLDLPEQKLTNALVLETLLRPENSVFCIPAKTLAQNSAEAGMTDAEALLAHVVAMDPPVRVILDVGAQILELTNRQVAEKWLTMTTADNDQVQAAIFFDGKDSLQVLGRHGHDEPLHISPFIGQLDQCVVFLDESHTRGTDLKLPEDYRALVTLGANLTKDRLVQACMRMRKLGKGQSVVFYVPDEIKTKIEQRGRVKNQKTDKGGGGDRSEAAEVGVIEVLLWSIGETHADLRRTMPLWAVQGKRFDRHEVLWTEALGEDPGGAISQTQDESEDEERSLKGEGGSDGGPDEDDDRAAKKENDNSSGSTTRSNTERTAASSEQKLAQIPQSQLSMAPALAQEFLETEAQTLDDKYRPRTTHSDDETTAQHLESEASTSTSTTSARLIQIIDRCHQVGSTRFDSAALQEEQERELSPEVEQERQIERPPPVQPATHILDPAVRSFITSGILPRNAPRSFMPAFTLLKQTSAAALLDVAQFPKDLLATKDFATTIVTKSTLDKAATDAFQRPVQWLLTSIPSVSASPLDMLIISPFEAQNFLPAIMMSGKVRLHIYAPRANLELCPLDGLDLYAAPTEPQRPIEGRELINQLNLFSGQLYFASLTEYRSMCDMLRLSWAPAREGVGIAADGFVCPEDGEFVNTFEQSPVAFLKVFLAKVRRDCQSINKTHMGRILNGELLTQKDFEGED